MENAHIVNDAFFGDIYATSGSVINIYGGQIDGYLFVTTSENGMPETQVTVFASDFLVDGVPVDPAAAELFLQGQELSGVYADGTPFAYMVDCAVTANFYLTIKLGWLVSEADIEVDQADVDFGQVDIGATQNAFVAVSNTGNANLTLQSISILQDDNVQFDFVPLQQIPLTIEPNMTVDIEVLFYPIAEGATEAVLQVASDDPDQAIVEINLFGEGLLVVLTAEEQMDIILEYYAMSLEDGSITGVGKPRRASKKALAFAKRLLLAERLIDAGYDKYALKALKIVVKQCDKGKRITGEGVPVLSEMLDELMVTLKESIEPKPKSHHLGGWKKKHKK
ncbi:MAG: choice-of-anchor D domain-containing protein [Planctomycetes bacterium]|nr:choice-of-anchor D domain-containing protein [Planctomycetota bacterium]